MLRAERLHTPISMQNLALTFGGQDRLEEVEEVEELYACIKTRTKVLEAEHPDTLMSMHNLALM